MIPKKRRVDQRSHGYLFAISSDLFHVTSARGCEQVRYFSHQKGGKLSENGFPGLIGGFGERTYNSPRVTGMAVGQPENDPRLSIFIKRSRGHNSPRQSKDGVFVRFASVRSEKVDHAICPCLRDQESRIHTERRPCSSSSPGRPPRFQFGA
jgi:hypothetical protein